MHRFDSIFTSTFLALPLDPLVLAASFSRDDVATAFAEELDSPLRPWAAAVKAYGLRLFAKPRTQSEGPCKATWAQGKRHMRLP